MDKAVTRNLFARGLKQQVAVSPDLASQVDELLEKQALAALSMAKKAGAAYWGLGRIEYLRQEKAGAWLKRFAINLDHNLSRNAAQQPIVARVSPFADGSGHRRNALVPGFATVTAP